MAIERSDYMPRLIPQTDGGDQCPVVELAEIAGSGQPSPKSGIGVRTNEPNRATLINGKTLVKAYLQDDGVLRLKIYRNGKLVRDRELGPKVGYDD
jgi:hypothetical protein